MIYETYQLAWAVTYEILPMNKEDLQQNGYLQELMDVTLQLQVPLLKENP